MRTGPHFPFALRAGAEGDSGRELVQVERREQRGEVAGEAVAQRLGVGWAPDDDLGVGHEEGAKNNSPWMWSRCRWVSRMSMRRALSGWSRGPGWEPSRVRPTP